MLRDQLYEALDVLAEGRGRRIGGADDGQGAHRVQPDRHGEVAALQPVLTGRPVEFHREAVGAKPAAVSAEGVEGLAAVSGVAHLLLDGLGEIGGGAAALAEQAQGQQDALRHAPSASV